MTGNFPIYFDHVQMALWRVFVVVEREIPCGYDETGETNWTIVDEIHEVGTFLSKSMAKVYYDSINLYDFVYESELKSGFVFHVIAKYEVWYVDECNPARCGEQIETKELY